MEKMKRINFSINTWDWCFPISIRLVLCGNNHRLYCLTIDFLCFHLTIDIDEDSYAVNWNAGEEE